MKKTLIKKTVICALTISCLATLASCKMGSSRTTNVFANKDIQAYAKKNDITYDNVKDIQLTEVNTSEKTFVYNEFNYSLVKDKTTSKYQLYMRYANKVFDIPTDEDELVTDINANNDLENSFGYFIISFDSGKKMAIDYNGDVVVAKQEYYSVKIDSHRRLMNYEPLFTGEKTIYDFVEIKEESTSDTVEIIYEIKAQFEKGLVKSFTRKTVTNDEIDYSIVKDYDTVDVKLKNYDFYTDSDAIYVKDLNGKLVSNFAFDFSAVTYYVLDDTMIYQAIKQVTRNDSYTFMINDDCYQLKTYKVNLKNGNKSELKNYNYYLENKTTILGYNEKNDRIYTAAIYASLYKIDDKKLSLSKTTAMLDKDGKILSEKMGEKGKSIKYFDDKTYIVIDGNYTSVISDKGKVKGTYYKNEIKVDYYNKHMFIDYTGSEGYFVDSDLKVIADISASEYKYNTIFKNGYVLINKYYDLYLGYFDGNEFKVIERFDEYVSTNTKATLDNKKYIYVTDSTYFSNIYVTVVKVGLKYNVEIHSVDGTLLKSVEGASNYQIIDGNEFFISITKDDDVMYYTVNYINAKTNNSYN